MDAALVGLGNMGAGIARSLLRGGHSLTVYNRTAQKAEALRADGANVAVSVEEACRHDVVLTMLADDPALQSVVYGERGILAYLKKGAIHVSLSTISVALADRLNQDHEKRGQGFLSAPVFGRPEAAEGAKLAVVVAGPEEYISRCKPLFAAMGPKLLTAGSRPSLANTVKLAGNFLIANVLESVSEAMAFARKSGVDARMLFEFLASTLFDAPVYKIYGNLIVEGKHEKVGFALPLGLKDVKLVLEAAGAQNVPMPIASVLRDRFLTALARGHANQDWSVVGRVAAEDAGLPPAK